MKRSISRHLVSIHPSSFSDLVAEGTIACSVCQAVYAPSRFHGYLLHASPIALESAFMSMCHFCFRCRRASCPNCWDHIHGICAQCAQETHIPFRTETPPFKGIASHSQTLSSSIHPHPPTTFLVKVEPGRLQNNPANLIENTSTPPTPLPLQPAQVAVASFTSDIDRTTTRPDQPSSRSIDEITTHPDRRHPRDLDTITTRPETDRSANVDGISAQKTHPPTRRRRRPARIFLSILLALLFLCVLVIIIAFFSESVNLFVARFLYIDIQATFLFLWHFFLNLF